MTPDEVYAVVWSPIADEFVEVYRGVQRIATWNNSSELVHDFTPHPGWINAIAWRPGTNTVATACNDALTHELLHTGRAHTDWVTSAQWSENATAIISGGHDHLLARWEYTR